MDDSPDDKHGARAPDSSPSKQHIVDELDALFGEEATPTDDRKGLPPSETQNVIRETPQPVPPIPAPLEVDRPVAKRAQPNEDQREASAKPAQAVTVDVSPLTDPIEKLTAEKWARKSARSTVIIYLIIIVLIAVGLIVRSIISNQTPPKIEAYDPTDTPSTSRDDVEHRIKAIAYDLIRIKACMTAWNTRIYNEESGGKDLSDELLVETTIESNTPINGSMILYTSASLDGKDVCGYYLIPGPQRANSVWSEVPLAQWNAITNSSHEIETAAGDITQLVDLSNNVGGQANPNAPSVAFDKDVEAAVKSYETKAKAVIAEISKMPLDQTQKDWLIANSQPRTSPPPLDVEDSDRNKVPGSGISGLWHRLRGTGSEEIWQLRVQVAQDMQKFEYYISRDLTDVPPR